MTLQGIKLVTFDVTNTLLKFRIPPWEYYALVAKQYGYNGNGKKLKNKLLNNYKTMAQQHPNFGKETISWQQWWTRVIELTFQGQLPGDTNVAALSKQLINDFKTPTCWQKAEGSMELIHLLKKYGITIGVISNFDPRLHEILFNLKLYKFFEFILTSYEVSISKPDKRIFEKAQEKCLTIINPSSCLHIGDDYNNDYQGAKGAGWHAVLVTNKLNLEDNQILGNVYPNLKVLYDKIEKNEIKLA